jgi:hypothetical protein
LSLTAKIGHAFVRVTAARRQVRFLLETRAPETLKAFLPAILRNLKPLTKL